MSEEIVKLIFGANLSFSAMLLAVMSVMASFYVKAQHTAWKRRLKLLLGLCVGVFLLGLVNSIVSFFYIVLGLSSSPIIVYNLIIALFVGELALLGFVGLSLFMVT